MMKSRWICCAVVVLAVAFPVFSYATDIEKETKIKVESFYLKLELNTFVPATDGQLTLGGAASGYVFLMNGWATDDRTQQIAGGGVGVFADLLNVPDERVSFSLGLAGIFTPSLARGTVFRLGVGVGAVDLASRPQLPLEQFINGKVFLSLDTPTADWLVEVEVGKYESWMKSELNVALTKEFGIGFLAQRHYGIGPRAEFSFYNGVVNIWFAAPVDVLDDGKNLVTAVAGLTFRFDPSKDKK